MWSMPPEKKERLEIEVDEKRLGKSKASLEIYIVRDQLFSEIYLFEFATAN
jgi:hypothetical protein